MADIINLRTARKARDRIARETDAATNRAAFGRSKADKRIDADATARRDALLDGARRET